MNYALKQTTRIAILVATIVFGFGPIGPKPAGGGEIYYRKGSDGVIRFSRTPEPGAVPFQVDAPKKPRTARAPSTPKAARNDAYDDIIAVYAERYGVEAALVKAIIHAESNFRPDARSHVGARGLMQLMPRTARSYGVAARRLHEPRANIHTGVRHLRKLLRTFKGSVRLAVAAYNAGEGAVKRHGGLPPYRETRGYVRKVLRYYERYAAEATITPVEASEELEASTSGGGRNA